MAKIYDHLLEGFRVLCYVKDTVYVTLEMSVIFFHDYSLLEIILSAIS